MEDYPTRDEVADGSFADGVRFAAEFDGDHNELADKVDEIAETLPESGFVEDDDVTDLSATASRVLRKLRRLDDVLDGDDESE